MGRGGEVEKEGGINNFFNLKKRGLFEQGEGWIENLQYIRWHWTSILLSIGTVKAGSSLNNITRPYPGLKYWVLDRLADSYSGATKGERGLVPDHTVLLRSNFSVAPQQTEHLKEANLIFKWYIYLLLSRASYSSYQWFSFREHVRAAYELIGTRGGEKRLRSVGYWKKALSGLLHLVFFVPLFNQPLLLSGPFILRFHAPLSFQESKRLLRWLKAYTKLNIKPLHREALYLS